MSVSIRPVFRHDTCVDCGQKFVWENGFSCAVHRRQAARVFLDITGLKHSGLSSVRAVEDTRIQIRKDSEGDPLTLDKAIRLKAVIEREIEKGTFNPKKYFRDTDQCRFENYVAAYLVHLEKQYQAGRIGKAHLQDVGYAFKSHFDYLNEMDVAEIKTGQIMDWLAVCPAPDKRKKKLLVYLHGLLEYARLREDVQVLPKFPRVDVERTKKLGLTEEQQAAILEKIPEKHKPIFRFAMTTGWRWNEIRALQIGSIDWKEKIIYLNHAFDRETLKDHPKRREHKGLAYPLTSALEEIIKPLCADRIGGFVFMYKPAKEPAPRNYAHRRLTHIFNKACAEAGMPDVTIYVFGRHSLACQLHERGASMEQIATALHNTSGVVRGHYATATLKRTAEVIGLRIKRL